MRRRDMLLTTGAALGLSAFPFRWAAAADKKQKLLYYTRSAGFVHSVVKRNGNQLAWSEKILTELGQKHGFEVVCSQDPKVFDGDLDQFAAIAFYTSGKALEDAQKKRLLDAISAGKGFVGFHAATDSFRRPGAEIDPYIAMIGGEFLTHGAQQSATLGIADPKFPGIAELGQTTSPAMNEEWYASHKFAKDLHVILVQETGSMKGPQYQRPPYPATWARKQGQGRVFYTSFGHREDIWTNPKVQAVMLGGIAWAMGNAEADVTPNIDKVTPGANQVSPPAPKQPKKKGK